MEKEYQGKKVEVEYDLCGEMCTACYVMEHTDDDRHLEFLYTIDHSNIAHLDYIRYDGTEGEPAGTPLVILKYVYLAKEAIVKVEGIDDVEPFLETIKDQSNWKEGLERSSQPPS